MELVYLVLVKLLTLPVQNARKQLESMGRRRSKDIALDEEEEKIKVRTVSLAIFPQGTKSPTLFVSPLNMPSF